MNERELRQRLRSLRFPDEAAAEERSWRVVRAAVEVREPASPPPVRRRLALALALGLAGLVISLTPPGAAIGDWVRDAIKPGHTPAKRELVSLPAPGRLLVTSTQGPWIVQRDGSRRLLGHYRDATWSPHGLFVAATRGRELVALEPKGRVHWSLGRSRAVSSPRWSPDGFRIAYLSGDSLRVVVGDGTGDRLLVRHVAPAAAAWSPRGTHVLAFVDRSGRVALTNTDSGATRWRTATGPLRTELAWSPSGNALLAVSESSVRLFDRRGRLLRELVMPPGVRAGPVAFEPRGTRFALVRHQSATNRSELVVVRANRRGVHERRLFAGSGRFSDLAWSPNGRWLLLAWRDADQWLFIRSAAVRKVLAVSGIARQFSPGMDGRARFPALGYWCCPP